MKIANIVIRKLACILLCLITFTDIHAAQAARRACLLDITPRIAEIEASNRNVYSADYMLEVAGLPYFTTQSLQQALSESSLIVLSSEVKKNAFTAEELNDLYEWVERGGILVSPGVSVVNNNSAAALAARRLFAVEKSQQTKSRYRLLWSEAHYADRELEYIDQPEERITSLAQGKKQAGESIKTFGYTLCEGAAADILATFDNGDKAVVRHQIGKGTVYLFGYLWRDVIQRSQLNRYFEAQRTSSNAFEPSADVTSLFLRSTFARNHRLSLWKFTIPDGYESLIIPTHDCDSHTAYDSMYYMSEYERDLRVKAHYFLTVHYFRDEGYLSAFYDNITSRKAQQLISDGHTVGSHSICHYPDFSITSRFPLTEISREDYARQTHHKKDETATGTSTGGSTWAEVVLSKQIIEGDLNNNVRSFRTGHLCMNDNIARAEQMGNYSFASCFAAGDVLSQFPYRERLERAWTGDFNGVLEMPLHISDVISASPINENNWMEKPAIWHSVQGKLQGNYAPAILLIHPNRRWKMQAEQMLVEMTDPARVGLYNFEDYGDFWNARRALDFDYTYDQQTACLDIRLLSDCDPTMLPHISFAADIETTDQPLTSARILNAEGTTLTTCSIKQLTPTRLLISATADPATQIAAPEAANPQSSVSPTAIYNLAGQQQTTLHRGINIVRDSNGNTKKILVR